MCGRVCVSICTGERVRTHAGEREGERKRGRGEMGGGILKLTNSPDFLLLLASFS